jgi:hypothetical protein
MFRSTGIIPFTRSWTPWWKHSSPKSSCFIMESFPVEKYVVPKLEIQAISSGKLNILTEDFKK